MDDDLDGPDDEPLEEAADGDPPPNAPVFDHMFRAGAVGD